MKMRFEAKVQKSLSVVKAAFDQELFLALTPPGMQLKLTRFDGCKPGDEVHLKMGAMGILQDWVSHITSSIDDENQWQFVDEGHVIPWPLKHWKHIHRVEAINESESLIIDDIEYAAPNPVISALMYPSLWLSFSIRPKRYQKYFNKE
jgi:hypothetical protein